MKRNSLVILAAVMSLLSVHLQSAPSVRAFGPMPLTVSTPIYLSQVSGQNSTAEGDRAQSNPSQGSGLTVPLVLGCLVLLTVGVGAWVLRSRTSPKPSPSEDPQPLAGDRGTIPVIPQQHSYVEEEIIPTQAVQDLQEAVAADPEIQDLPTVVAVTQDISDELQLKLETLQAAIASAQQRFRNLSNNLEQEIAQYIQVLPDSILSQPSPEFLPMQQQALEKLEALQEVFLDLELPDSAYFKQGNALFNAQRYEDAITHYDKAITLNSDAALAWFNTAYIYALQGDMTRSLRYLKQSIHLNPDCLALATKHPEFDALCKDSTLQELLND